MLPPYCGCGWQMTTPAAAPGGTPTRASRVKAATGMRTVSSMRAVVRVAPDARKVTSRCLAALRENVGDDRRGQTDLVDRAETAGDGPEAARDLDLRLLGRVV